MNTTVEATVEEQPIIVLRSRIPELDKKFASINRRAAKLDLPATSYKVVAETILTVQIDTGYTDELGIPVTRTRKLPAYEIEITGEALCIPGWQFAARVEPFEDGVNLIHTAPTFEGVVPTSYRATDPGHCDHCGKRRHRKETFIVQSDDGNFFQVGRNCLRDFTGHNSPEHIARALGWLAEIRGWSEESCFSGGKLEVDYRADTVLAWASVVIRKEGWGASASDNPTRWTVHTLLCGGPDKHDFRGRNALHDFLAARERFDALVGAVEDCDIEEAAATLAWVRSLEDPDNDYLANLVTILSSNWVAEKHLGLAVSATRAYRRHLEIKEKWQTEREGRDARIATARHLGEIGEKIEVDVTLTDTRTIETQFGTSVLYSFEDADGNVVKWFSSGRGIDDQIGTSIHLVGTVKKHDEYRGLKQTLLTRCKAA
tara:strand:+ start:19 stop:1308 length:1290 start_codon:yes stop_codon:yes gene_type:complete